MREHERGTFWGADNDLRLLLGASYTIHLPEIHHACRIHAIFSLLIILQQNVFRRLSRFLAGIFFSWKLRLN